MGQKRDTGKTDETGKPIMEGDQVMAGSPPKFIPIEWKEHSVVDDKLGPGVLVGFFIPDKCRVLIGKGHPGFEKPGQS